MLRIPSPLTDHGYHSSRRTRLRMPPPCPSHGAAPSGPRRAAGSPLRALRGHLRRVLENLAHLVRLPTAGEVFNVKPDERTQEQRWAAIYYSVKSLAHAAHHDDQRTAGFTWTRADAEAVLAATAGLLRRLISKNE